MAKHGKRYNAAKEKIDSSKVYEPDEAMEAIADISSAKFDETIEVHIRLGVDPRHADQQVRGSVVLPNGTGKEVRVAVFAAGSAANEAQAAGADFVGAEDLADKIQKENWLDFDIAIATPDMMRYVGRLGKILGPQGLMPNPKSGTVTTDVATAVKEAKAGKIEYRLDKSAIIHCIIGKASFGKDKLLENFNTLLSAVLKARPAAAKGRYIRSCTVVPSMGPGVRVNTNNIV